MISHNRRQLDLQQTQVIAEHNTAGVRRRRHTHHLRGTVFCGSCGARLSTLTAKGRFEYFYCLGSHNRRTNCEEPYTPARSLERQVEQLYKQITLPEDLRRQISADLERDRSSRDQTCPGSKAGRPKTAAPRHRTPKAPRRLLRRRPPPRHVQIRTGTDRDPTPYRRSNPRGRRPGPGGRQRGPEDRSPANRQLPPCLPKSLPREPAAVEPDVLPGHIRTEQADLNRRIQGALRDPPWEGPWRRF